MQMLKTLAGLLLLLSLLATSSSVEQHHPQGAGEEPGSCGYQHCLLANNSLAGPGSLYQALSHLAALDSPSSAQLKLTAGVFNLSDNDLVTFVNWSNVSLAGAGPGKDDTVLRCAEDVGIVFGYSSRVTLRDITIQHCGRWFNTTSVSVTDLNAANASQSGTKFTLSKSGVYFYFCTDLTLANVQVSNCPGMGVTIYNTGGRNSFLGSAFTSNHLNAQDSYPGGGGVVIETSHCVPGDSSCRDDRSELETSDASYEFEHCSFWSNRATSHYLPFDSVYPHARSHVGLGRGGGLSISFKGHAYRNKVLLNACTFVTNRAEWGAAFYLALGDTSVNNSILVINSSFSNNNFRDGRELDRTNTTVGGAIRIELVSYPPNQQLWPGYVSNVAGNSVTLRNTPFWNNFATWGGAVSFTTTRNLPGQASTNSLLIEECTFAENCANVAASAIDVTSWKPDIVDSLEPFTQPVIRDCTFDSNKMLFFDIADYPVGFGILYVSGVPTAFAGENKFLYNDGTSLVVYGTYLSVLESSRMNFTGNTGRRGGALSFIGNSWLIAHEGTSFLFDGNSVGTYGLGGAVYSVHFGEHDMVYDYNCFFRYHLFSVPPSLWNATFVFRNNWADQERNSIYTTSSRPCTWHVADRLSEELEVGAFCENSTWLYAGPGRSCRNEVTTGPKDVVITNFNIDVVPGWNTTLGVTTLNDFGSPVPPVLTATPSQESDRSLIAVASATEYISDDGIVIYGKEKSVGVNLLLMTLDPRVVASELKISVLPCPPGFTSVLCTGEALAGMTCDCVCADIPGVQCNNETKEAYLLRHNCMSYSNGDNSDIVVARCPYNRDNRIKLSNLTAEQLEAEVCEPYHRRGYLCSKCKDGYGVAVNRYGYGCVECKGREKYDWALFLLLELGPITLVCFLVILFGVGVAAPSMNAFVFFSQIVSVGYNTNMYTWFFGAESVGKELSYPVFVLYGVWNLEFFQDFLPGICLHDGLKALHILVINYVKALYPMVLLLVCYVCVQLYDRNCRVLRVLWKPFRYCQKLVYKIHQRKTSIVDAFATLIVLSYSKFMYVSFPLVNLVSVYKLSGNSTEFSSEMLRYRYYFDPDQVVHHSMANVVYFMLGVMVLVVFVGLPPIFLILYPLRVTQSCLGRLNVRIQISLRTFADIFIGAFRDGTSGSGHDCRWFAALYMIFRIIFLAVSTSSNMDTVAAYLIRQILCTLGVFIFALVQPYKEEFYNRLDTSFFALLAVLNALSFYNSHLVALRDSIEETVFYFNYVLMFLPLLYLVSVITYNILAWRGCFAQSRQSKDVMEVEEDLSTDGRSTSEEEIADSNLPDRFVHPQNYTTLDKFSSLGTSRGKGGSRKRQASTEESPLLPGGYAGSVQGYTV